MNHPPRYSGNHFTKIYINKIFNFANFPPIPWHNVICEWSPNQDSSIKRVSLETHVGYQIKYNKVIVYIKTADGTNTVISAKKTKNNSKYLLINGISEIFIGIIDEHYISK